MDRLDLAIHIARSAHDGQKDKMGLPYFEHCRRVAERIIDPDAKIVAYLHDVVEKGPGWTLGRIQAEGFPARITDAVDALTRRKSERWADFVYRAARNGLARPVKHADLEDNLVLSQRIGADDHKYREGLRILDNIASAGTHATE